MNVLIAVDYEGVAGMVTWDSDDNQRMRSELRRTGSAVREPGRGER